MICPFKLPLGTVSEGRPHAIEREGTGRGVQWLFTFPNGWGASVVRFYVDLTLHKQADGTPTFPDASRDLGVGSHGAEQDKWELAVLGKDGSIHYKNRVANGDVLGWLDEKQVSNLLARIARFKES